MGNKYPLMHKKTFKSNVKPTKNACAVLWSFRVLLGLFQAFRPPDGTTLWKKKRKLHYGRTGRGLLIFQEMKHQNIMQVLLHRNYVSIDIQPQIELWSITE